MRPGFAGRAAERCRLDHHSDHRGGSHRARNRDQRLWYRTAIRPNLSIDQGRRGERYHAAPGRDGLECAGSRAAWARAARFAASDRLEIETGDGVRTVEFESAVVATGSQPLEIPGLEFDQDRVISSREILQLEAVPDEIIVVGGGYIGMEAVTKFAKFGSRVKVVEARERVLGMFEAEIVDSIQETSEMYNNEIYTSALASGVEYDEAGRPLLVVEQDGV
ncbi:MAG: FAD-dependent oxidoreductase, partial [Alphaproteobacteria bacterium]